ncbi:MAG: hypothetical protein M0R37_07715 [Bacteroidales bacterium]|nr:hypothetical protein [Bacteroidales bacterium]
MPDPIRGPYGSPLLDNFNRADGDPGANWAAPYDTAFTDKPNILSNKIDAGGSYKGMRWDTLTDSADCEIFCTPGASAGHGDLFLHARSSATIRSTGGCYYTNSNGVSSFSVGIGKWEADVFTTLTTGPVALAAGTPIALSCIGSLIQAFYWNGANWVLGCAAIDNTFTAAGYLGVGLNGTLDNFGGGWFTTTVTGSTNPTPTLEAALGEYPLAPVNWINLTTRARSTSTSRGRRDEYERNESGVLADVLDNRDNQLNPENTNGDYYPMKPVVAKRLTFSWGGISYPVWRGFSYDYPQEYPGALDAVVAQNGSDLFYQLNSMRFPDGQSFASELSSTRVSNVLTALGLDPADHYIGTGNITLAAAADVGGQNPLQHLMDVDTTENGLMFVGAEGLLHFQGYQSLLQSAMVAPTITFGPDAGEVPYQLNGKLDFGGQKQYNVVQVTPSSGNVQESRSVATNDIERTYALSLPMMASDIDALARADYERLRLATIGLRIPEITIFGARDPNNIWPKVLPLEYGDRVSFHFAGGPAGTPEFTKTMRIGRISWELAPGSETVLKLQLIPADEQVYWMLGIPGFSELGTTNRLAP